VNATTVGRPEVGVLIIPDLPVAEIVDRAVHVEASGLDSVWVADEKFYRDPFVTLTAIAARTRRVDLATCVTEPYARHPALIAMAMGSLHEHAPGRVRIGMGAGGSGFPPMGVVRRSPVTALTEAVAIIRGLLAGEEVNVEGKVISFTAGRLNFPTVPLPIFLAGRGEKVLGTAGRIADGVITAPFASSVTLAGAVEAVEAGVARRTDGARPPVVARVDVAISEDPRAARDAVRYMVAMPIWSSYPNLEYLEPTGVTVPDQVLELMATRRYEAIGWSAPHIPDGLVDHFAVAGTFDDVVARLRDLGAVADQVLVNPVPTPDHDVDQTIAAVARARDVAFPAHAVGV
jgi:5,10-methylenetetrahydromethanopterin reductase